MPGSPATNTVRCSPASASFQALTSSSNSPWRPTKSKLSACSVTAGSGTCRSVSGVTSSAGSHNTSDAAIGCGRPFAFTSPTGRIP